MQSLHSHRARQRKVGAVGAICVQIWAIRLGFRPRGLLRLLRLQLLLSARVRARVGSVLFVLPCDMSNQNPVLKLSTQSGVKLKYNNYLWLVLSLTNLHLPVF